VAMSWLDELHATLTRRASCEQVASIIAAGARLNANAAHQCALVAAGHPAWHVSSMPDDYERAEPNAGPQLAAAEGMFGWRRGLWGAANREPDPSDPEYLRHVVTLLGLYVGGWQPGMDWKINRLDRRSRHILDPEVDLSRRQYDRRVRLLRRISDKADAIEERRAFRDMVLVGRSGFAHEIPARRFKADPAAACFIAYYVARKGRRREFTLAGRENPVDQLTQALYARCKAKGSRTDWYMIAMVYPRPAVIAKLSDEERGMLTGRWWQVMSATADRLARVWPWRNEPDPVKVAYARQKMIVRRGMDSSAWNITASAYNTARAGWLNVGHQVNPALLDPFCPGKVMRLMAADLAFWHQASGGDVDPNTRVWAELPLPWDVIHGLARCDAGQVRYACRRVMLDPDASGWTAPRATGPAAQFRPTPELVHGVEVASPQWAALLRGAGVFGGTGKARPDTAAVRLMADDAGVVTGKLPAYKPDGVLAD